MGLEPGTPGSPGQSLATRLFTPEEGKKYETTHIVNAHRGIYGTVLRDHDTLSNSDHGSGLGAGLRPEEFPRSTARHFAHILLIRALIENMIPVLWAHNTRGPRRLVCIFSAVIPNRRIVPACTTSNVYILSFY